MSAIFDVAGVTKSFGGLTVNRDVSMRLGEGDRVALIGPNGAGKTTFVNLVTGHLVPDAGRIALGGVDITRLDTVRRVACGLVRTFQVTRLFADMTPADHVVMTILRRMGKATRILARFGGDTAANDEAYEILDTLGLGGAMRRKVGEIAYGQQRLVELAIALAHRPKVLLLDEPAAGVASSDVPRIERALESLPPALAVLMIDHDMDLVMRFAKRVAVLVAGELVFDGAPANVAQDAKVREAYLGSYGHASRDA
jgi:branched-chain amino acid transport system ATP-binding protein